MKKKRRREEAEEEQKKNRIREENNKQQNKQHRKQKGGEANVPKTLSRDEAFSAPRSPKSAEIGDEKWRFIEAHKAFSHFSHFFGFASCVRNLYLWDFIRCDRRKSHFSETPKNQGQGKNWFFDIFLPCFFGPRNHCFCRVFEAPERRGSIKLAWTAENGVQLRTRKHICVYIYMCIYIYIWLKPLVVGRFGSKITKFPQFYSKIHPTMTPT